MKNVIILNSVEFNGVDLLRIIDWFVWLGFKVKVKYKGGWEDEFDENGLIWDGSDDFWD